MHLRRDGVVLPDGAIGLVGGALPSLLPEPVESAGRPVVQAKLKRSGRHWARANFNPVVALRMHPLRVVNGWPTAEHPWRRPLFHRFQEAS